MSSQEEAKPQSVQLTSANCYQLLGNYIEAAQKVGSFILEEANVLKLSLDICITNKVNPNYPQITAEIAKNNLFQAVAKGQVHGGAYSLNDAFNIVQIINFIKTLPVLSPIDLSELAEPIPLSNITTI